MCVHILVHIDTGNQILRILLLVAFKFIGVSGIQFEVLA